MRWRQLELAMARAGVSVSELTRRTGISRAMGYALLAGNRKATLKYAEAFAAELGVTSESLLDFSPPGQIEIKHIISSTSWRADGARSCNEFLQYPQTWGTRPESAFAARVGADHNSEQFPRDTIVIADASFCGISVYEIVEYRRHGLTAVTLKSKDSNRCLFDVLSGDYKALGGVRGWIVNDNGFKT